MDIVVYDDGYFKELLGMFKVILKYDVLLKLFIL